MSSKFIVTLLFALFVAIGSLQAQDKSSKEGKLSETQKLELEAKKKAALDARKALGEKRGNTVPQGNMTGERPGGTKGVASGAASMMGASDLQLNADEQKVTINGYKADFLANPYGTPENTLAAITLYAADGKDAKKIGVIHFYAKGAKALSDTKVLDDKGMAVFAYEMSSFSDVQGFLAEAPKLVLVKNNKTKTAYITTDVLPTRAR